MSSRSAAWARAQLPTNLVHRHQVPIRRQWVAIAAQAIVIKAVSSKQGTPNTHTTRQQPRMQSSIAHAEPVEAPPHLDKEMATSKE